jgi:hypothetical protein
MKSNVAYRASQSAMGMNLSKSMCVGELRKYDSAHRKVRRRVQLRG